MISRSQRAPFRSSRRETREAGQASVEYALVIVAAAVVATVLISWATNTNVLGSLFDYVVGVVKGKVA
jgi:Flp pilus assembly pilin Flp